MTAKVPVWPGVVIKGKVQLFDSSRYEQWRHQLEGQEIELILRKKMKRRSPEANSYLHYILGAIADYTGHTKEEVKVWAKETFAATYDEYGIAFLQHTSEMATAECAEFIDKIYMQAHINWPEIRIETPDEYNRMTQEL